MKKALFGLAVAGLACAANAQNTITYTMTLDDGDGLILPNQVLNVTITALMAPGKIGLGGTIMSLSGANLGLGTSSYVRNPALAFVADDGDLVNIDHFQLPPFFNPSFDASNPIYIGTLTWTAPASFVSGTVVTLGDTHLNNSVYTNTTGASVEYTAVSPGTSWTLVPAPASAALLGLGALVAGRRRR